MELGVGTRQMPPRFSLGRALAEEFLAREKPMQHEPATSAVLGFCEGRGRGASAGCRGGQAIEAALQNLDRSGLDAAIRAGYRFTYASVDACNCTVLGVGSLASGDQLSPHTDTRDDRRCAVGRDKTHQRSNPSLGILWKLRIQTAVKLRCLRQPRRLMIPRPVANSGSPAGKGVADGSTVQSTQVQVPGVVLVPSILSTPWFAALKLIVASSSIESPPELLVFMLIGWGRTNGTPISTSPEILHDVIAPDTSVTDPITWLIPPGPSAYPIRSSRPRDPSAKP